MGNIFVSWAVDFEHRDPEEDVFASSRPKDLSPVFSASSASLRKSFAVALLCVSVPLWQNGFPLRVTSSRADGPRQTVGALAGGDVVGDFELLEVHHGYGVVASQGYVGAGAVRNDQDTARSASYV